MAKQVAIDFLARLKGQGIKDLQKQSTAAEKSLKSLQRQMLKTFSFVAVAAFLRRSTQAFLEEDKAIRRLRQSLVSVGQGYRALGVEDFISKTQRSARVLDSELRPAFNTIINAGIEFQKAQKVLNVALDTSAATGKDLQSVVAALTRAYNGSNTSIQRLNIGLSKTTLESATFDEVLAILSNRFEGQAATAADSYAGKMTALTIAVDEAQEAIGKDLIESLEKLADGDFDRVIGAIAGAANALGGVIKSVSFTIANTREIIKQATESPFSPFDEERFAEIRRQFFGPKVRTDTPAASRQSLANLREQRKVAAEIDKNRAKAEKDRLALLKKQQTETKRTAELQRLRSAIQFRFDIDAINLQAALKRQLSATDRERVLQLAALKNSDYQDDTEAIKTLKAATTGRYDDAMNAEVVYQLLKQAGYAADQLAIKALTAMNPEINFKDNLQSVIDRLQELIQGKYTISIGATITVPNIPAPGGTASSGIGAGSTFDPGGFRKADESRRAPSESYVPPPAAIKPSFIPPGALLGEAGGEPAMGFKDIFAPDTASFRYFEEMGSSRLRNLYEPGAIPSNFDIARFRARDEGVTVNVNVGGSVIAQNDLVQTITDAVYQTQRSGNSLLIAE